MAIILLLVLIGTPLYFAKNFAKVAGVKSAAKFLVVSQIEKFPNLILSQSGDKYEISFTKYALQQAYLSVLIINNPTQTSQKYSLEVASGEAKLFFGEDLKNLSTQISVPSTTSVPVSLLSPKEASTSSQTVEFRIKVE